jgi:hypothetical protein
MHHFHYLSKTADFRGWISIRKRRCYSFAPRASLTLEATPKFPNSALLMGALELPKAAVFDLYGPLGRSSCQVAMTFVSPWTVI